MTGAPSHGARDQRARVTRGLVVDKLLEVLEKLDAQRKALELSVKHLEAVQEQRELRELILCRACAAPFGEIQKRQDEACGVCRHSVCSYTAMADVCAHCGDRLSALVVTWRSAHYCCPACSHSAGDQRFCHAYNCGCSRVEVYRRLLRATRAALRRLRAGLDDGFDVSWDSDLDGEPSRAS